jgi:anaerobic dimethyl sulfoxide reductase subunit A
VYSEERLKYPLRRVGERGEGKFERVSWDEALDEVAEKLKGVKEAYGNSSIFYIYGAGNQGMLHGPLPAGMLLTMFGGFTTTWGAPSYEGAMFASMATYGTIHTGSSREDLFNSKIVIMWGWNPANTIWDPETSLTLAKVHEQGTKIVCVDPRYTDSTATFSDQWVPIRPGTDTAMLIAMAYVIVDEGLHDKEFIDKHTVGFNRYMDYVLGKEDGEPKTPRWAEQITGVSAKVIADLAGEYATHKPAALIAGWGPARAAFGEQYCRAANVLTAITGNIGVKGGYASGFMRAYSSRDMSYIRPDADGKKIDKTKGIPASNPVEHMALPRPDSLYKLSGGTNCTSARVHWSKVYDAILRGKEGGYPADPKLGYIVAGNLLNQHPNVHRGIKALKSLESIVVHEQFMTPTAKFGDIVLPINTFMERNDVAPPWLGSPYYIYLNKAIDSMHESMSDLEACSLLSEKLGMPPLFGGMDEDQILRIITSKRDDIPDYDAMKRDGVLKIKLDEPYVAFKEHREDPDNKPLPTLSGKIEIYCEHIAKMNNPLIPPIPKYMTHAESFDAPLADKYPIQLITTHHKARAHSTWFNVPWAKEIEPHMAWINPVDANRRGVGEGEEIDLFNDRGRMRIPAKVTERIMPGVVNVGQGAWYDPDENGVDRGGCVNVLTIDEASPGGAATTNSALVEVEKSPDKEGES